ncbi:peroxide/acid stress response protein YhcN [Pluralibacter gergoviae]|uniref:peroxide/acid stress response protein YhcN n=1 Tax=uncultured Pluralibacter sp. TaxID=1490864 RepID=UPI00260AB617|nr:peroxide/acid stress response protein YhcN [uncultured Pluralibacter sp.]
MKIKTTLSVLGMLSVLSFGAFAADSINAEQATNRQPVGTISVGAVGSSPMDMNEMLSQKAQQQGASSYRIIEARSGAHWHATAELYK